MTENIVQWLAREIFAQACVRLSREGVLPVLLAHDEFVTLASEREAEAVLRRVLDALAIPPSWAPDLPLAAEGRVAARYGK
jgi:DNA polymerase